MKDYHLITCESMLVLIEKDIQFYTEILKVNSKQTFFNKSTCSDKLLLSRLQSIVNNLKAETDNHEVFKTIYMFYKIERENCNSDNALILFLRKSLLKSLGWSPLIKVSLLDAAAECVMSPIQMDAISDLSN